MEIIKNEKPSYWIYSNDQNAVLVNGAIRIITPYDTDAFGLVGVKPILNIAQSEIDQVVSYSLKSDSTKAIAVWDNTRDNCAGNMLESFETASKRTNPVAARSGHDLVVLVKSYSDNIADENYKEESMIITSLLKDLKSPKFQEDIKNTNTEHYVQELEDAQKGFEEEYHGRADEQSKKEKPDTKGAKKAVRVAVDRLLKFLELMHPIHYNNEDFLKIRRGMNQLISDLNAESKLRRTSYRKRKDNEKQGEQPNDQDDPNAGDVPNDDTPNDQDPDNGRG